MHQNTNIQMVDYVTTINADRQSTRKTVAYPARESRAIADANLQNLISTIAEFTELSAGWDGYGARAIGTRVVANALQAILTVSTFGGGISLPVVQPEVVGTISLSWRTIEGEAYLELGESRYSGYIETRSGQELYFKGDLTSDTRKVFLTIYEQLFSSGQATPLFTYKMATENSLNAIGIMSFSPANS